ncbi:MAG: phosphoenolpyruvate synthase [Sphingomonadales bacterium]|nr:phosphoenolpyruvate synthase [Sphingomonadales bacterium]
MKYIVPLSELSLRDLPEVGGKNASLGEMIQHLTKLGIRVPDGYAITVTAYEEYINHNGFRQQIRSLVEGIEAENIVDLRKKGNLVRQLIRNGTFPQQIEHEICRAYKSLSEQYGQEMTDVAVRSSATAEDLPDASFAGQQETFLNVRGPQSLLDSVRHCFASLFTDRAIVYRHQFGFDHFTVGLSVGVQKMVRSDLAASGVAFSLDTESGFKDVVVINASYGLGELVVQGAVSPDEFILFKPSLLQGYSSIVEKKLGQKDRKMIYGDDSGKLTKTVNLYPEQRNRFSISDEQALEIARWVCTIEKHYTELKGQWCPMDVEWAVDGLTGDLMVVQARPETIHSRKDNGTLVEYRLNVEAGEPLVRGVAVGDGLATGEVAVMYGLDGRDGSVDAASFVPGSVLVTEMTDPDWEPIMKKASAIVTNKGGRTCHAAIVAREMGLPAIVGSMDATERLAPGQKVTVSCCQGDTGMVFPGLLDYTIVEIHLDELPKVKTPVMLNVASPDIAFKFASLPHAGVGLAREEFIINNFIKVHPQALLEHHSLGDAALSKEIAVLMRGFPDEETYFIKKLSYGIARIACAFYPQKVIVRLSDFKTNEYKNLLGGQYFEPEEENPMIGWRGASRYYSKDYRAAFGMEIKAIRRAREKMGLGNIVVMIPFCRTVEELLNVYEVMAENGLRRGENGLEIYLMAELPSNILMAEEFAAQIDGFSIGSNDLTQLTLGLDRDSALVSHLYDERNPAVKRLISQLIQVAKRTGTKVGICGQGPSDYPDFATFLVREGIDSISVTPDSLLKTLKALAQVEAELASEANS